MFKSIDYNASAANIKSLIMLVFKEYDVILQNDEITYNGVLFLDSEFKVHLDKPFERYLLELDFVRKELELRQNGAKIDYLGSQGMINNRNKAIQDSKKINNELLKIKAALHQPLELSN